MKSGAGKALAGEMAKRRKIRIAPSKRGSLHSALGVPQGTKIPVAKINAAANSSSVDLKRKAVFAKNAASWGK